MPRFVDSLLCAIQQPLRGYSKLGNLREEAGFRWHGDCINETASQRVVRFGINSNCFEVRGSRYRSGAETATVRHAADKSARPNRAALAVVKDENRFNTHNP